MPLTATQRAARLPWADVVALIWFALDAVTHLVLEASYLYYALLVPGGAASSDSWAASIWVEYGKADTRWAGNDPGVAALELLTVFIAGPLAAWLCWAIWTRRADRHVWQVVISVMELYGGGMTFIPEWIAGSPSLRTHHPVLTWVYLAFMNGVWVYVPLVLLAESIPILIAACDATSVPVAPAYLSSAWHTSVAVILAIYAVAVPLILATMSPEHPMV
ncbi:uncharacterized protein AMSG_03193 [Thecamonas trahens ATCC 50062]|uniref:EXPERA domain-containing protein n=1 Tax=Thecamonas trahens ATCC 50062 TaxID=461836 RepID=A0A0L0D3I1_THETB|nr:hypothetical protein AMSG_03193 [Thecamonas trahens ATCC 50062]KNC46765.1 hypothetical protein AMSG_03193 [Thecamonas trahens ATCC 50062]|eukprot:XP_013760043.1 hypothetical protein AMSG_03193 [Thecamonas trahens ATCC 50062]